MGGGLQTATCDLLLQKLVNTNTPCSWIYHENKFSESDLQTSSLTSLFIYFPLSLSYSGNIAKKKLLNFYCHNSQSTYTCNFQGSKMTFFFFFFPYQFIITTILAV